MNIAIILSFSISVILLILGVQWYIHKRPIEKLGFQTMNAIIWFLFGHGLGFFLSALQVACSYAYAGGFRVSWAIPAETPLSTSLGYYFFFLGLLTLNSLKEELVYRAYPLSHLESLTSKRYFIIILSALLFSAVHHLIEPFTLSMFLYRSIFGILFAQAFLYSKSIWFPIGIHSAWNWVQTSFSGNWRLGGVFKIDDLSALDYSYISLIIITIASALFAYWIRIRQPKNI